MIGWGSVLKAAAAGMCVAFRGLVQKNGDRGCRDCLR
jgi:hypothetical protein